MTPRKIRRSLTRDELKEVRGLIAKAQWKHSDPNGHYKDDPHSYIAYEKCPLGITKREWTRLSKLISTCGEPRHWRGRRYIYLIVDDYAHWTIWDILNRAPITTLDEYKPRSEPAPGQDVTF
jgi:hypothetical protein